MASGKRSRRTRAARVPTPPTPGRERRRASPRVLAAAAAAIAVVVAGVAIGFSLGGGGDETASSEPPATLPGAAEVRQLLKGIPQNGNVLGRPDAPVHVVEYVDLQCPYCRQFEEESTSTLLAGDVRSGRAKLELRVLAFIGPDSERGRAAAIAAADQNRMFDLVLLLFMNQGAENSGWLDDRMIAAAAASIPGLDGSRLADASESPSVTERAQAFDRQATADGVQGTPTILVGRSGEQPRTVALTSPTDVASVRQAIDRAHG